MALVRQAQFNYTAKLTFPDVVITMYPEQVAYFKLTNTEVPEDQDELAIALLSNDKLIAIYNKNDVCIGLKHIK